MKFNYPELDYELKGERSCYTPGRVYTYIKDSRGEHRGLFDNDLLLCIRKSGDCHYDFLRIVETGSTNYDPEYGRPIYTLHQYFKVIDEKFSVYGGMKEAFPNMETLSELDLIHILFTKKLIIPLYNTLCWV